MCKLTLPCEMVTTLRAACEINDAIKGELRLILETFYLLAVLVKPDCR